MIQLIAISLLIVVVNHSDAASYYDYIVVGAGVAGSVVASRLSEDAGITVLLLEAGAEPNLVLRSPAATFLATDSDRDWRYLSEPLQYSGEFLNHRQMRLSTGKVLGGGSILNAITWVRESRKGFKIWKEMGISGWSYEDNLPYYIKSEKINIRKYKQSKARGHEGPIRIAMTNFQTDIPQSIINAGGEAGYRTDYDYNDKFRLGFFRGQQNLDKGMRFDSVRAYLDPVRSRKNLEIRTRATVKKVLFDDTMRATGVEYEDNEGDSHVVYVNYEVVMAAGGLSTPKIMLQSGIGPRERLRAVGIKQLLELPVGKNLHDHFGCFAHQYSINRDLIRFGVSTVTGAANVTHQSPGAGLSNFMNWGAFLNTVQGPHDPEDFADVQVMGVEMAFDKMQVRGTDHAGMKDRTSC
jgi:choline dehydrogenase-like flavoprotein